jgi:hypothetical protein
VVFVSEDTFLESVARVCGVPLPEMKVLADSGPVLDLPLTRLSFDSLYLLELQLELEEHGGTGLDPENFVLTPATTFRDVYQALSAH